MTPENQDILLAAMGPIESCQYPLTELCYFGTFNNQTNIMRDDAGVYWVGNRRFSSVNDAYDYAEAHQ